MYVSLNYYIIYFLIITKCLLEGIFAWQALQMSNVVIKKNDYYEPWKKTDILKQKGRCGTIQWCWMKVSPLGNWNVVEIKLNCFVNMVLVIGKMKLNQSMPDKVRDCIEITYNLGLMIKWLVYEAILSHVSKLINQLENWLDWHKWM